MFVKTKDGRIAEVKDNMVVKQSDVLRLVYKDKPHICVLCGEDEVIKQADTIEDLFDEVVIIGKKPILFKADMFFKTPQEARGKCECYGAIWTSEGLKYKAKMNEKGEWELL